MRTSKLIQRIIVSYNFIRYGKGNVRLMTCGKCGSVFIHPISESPQEGEIITDQRHIDRYWVEFNQCMKCGAVCEETQLWNFDGDAKKINPNIKVVEK